MSDYIDRLPAAAREKLRKRLRSPEEYERLREKVRGPEDLEREMEKNAEFAEAKLHLESDPKVQEQAKDIVRKAVLEQGIEAVLEQLGDMQSDTLNHGEFQVTVSEKDHVPCLAIKPASTASRDVASGKVQEALVLTPALQKQVLAFLKTQSSS